MDLESIFLNPSNNFENDMKLEILVGVIITGEGMGAGPLATWNLIMNNIVMVLHTVLQ